MSINVDFTKYGRMLDQANPIRIHGKVSEIIGLVVEGFGPAASIGEVCGIFPNGQEGCLNAEVVGFKKGKVLLMPLESIQGDRKSVV
jgi:flagellum-specific ATP synthase